MFFAQPSTWTKLRGGIDAESAKRSQICVEVYWAPIIDAAMYNQGVNGGKNLRSGVKSSLAARKDETVCCLETIVRTSSHFVEGIAWRCLHCVPTGSRVK